MTDYPVGGTKDRPALKLRRGSPGSATEDKVHITLASGQEVTLSAGEMRDLQGQVNGLVNSWAAGGEYSEVTPEQAAISQEFDAERRRRDQATEPQRQAQRKADFQRSEERQRRPTPSDLASEDQQRERLMRDPDLQSGHAVAGRNPNRSPGQPDSGWGSGGPTAEQIGKRDVTHPETADEAAANEKRERVLAEEARAAEIEEQRAANAATKAQQAKEKADADAKSKPVLMPQRAAVTPEQAADEADRARPSGMFTGQSQTEKDAWKP